MSSSRAVLNAGAFDSKQDIVEISKKISNKYEILEKIEQDFTVADSEASLWREAGGEEAAEIDEFRGISLERGTFGVFDVEEFVEILKQEKLDNIVVIVVPKELQYVDYMVITTGRSPRQMTAVSQFLRKIFKKRCLPTDHIPVVEGQDNKDWVAMDLGNIALHIFSAKYRKVYDLETLWTVGSKYDDQSNQVDDSLSTLLKQYSFPVSS